MNISEIKDLLAQFDTSTLREFSYKNNGEELNLSKNQTSSVTTSPVAPTVEVVASSPQDPVAPVAAPAAVETPATPVEEASAPAQAAEGEVIESPLVGVAYLSPSPEKPAFVSVGDTVKVYAKVKEGNRERTQVFEGTVIKRQNGSNRETFTVRKSSNGIGVEKTWPLHSPIVEKIEVTRRGKVRRAKLFYLRDRVGKKAKVKELVK